MTVIEKLQNVLTQIKHTFVGKDEVIELLGLALVAGENAFLYGPPGTAKSAIVRALAKRIAEGNNFEYLLTKFTEPNEIFGPFDIRKLREGDLITNTKGMIPEASIIFLDELFNANSAILNSLLTALNEKIFRRGSEFKKLPALMFVGASNALPEEEALNALYDRFLVRIPSGFVETQYLQQVLLAGWKLENNLEQEDANIHVSEIKELQKMCKQMDLTPIISTYIDLVINMRNIGIAVSDRRAVKLQNLIAASALLSGRNKAQISDLWVLKYIWDTEEQIELLESLINNIVQGVEEENNHPMSKVSKIPNPEDLMKELELLLNDWNAPEVSNQTKAIVKDKLRYIQSRTEWVENANQKEVLQIEIDKLWKQIMQEI